jgi:hypothetical protein
LWEVVLYLSHQQPTSKELTVIKFNKFNVTNGTDKAKVHYSLDNRCDGRACVTIYAKDYDRALGHIFFEEYINNTDTMTDYFDKGRVVLFADHPLYAAARTRAEDVAAEQKAKYEARRASWALAAA